MIVMMNVPYPETADIETSSDGYANRFSGAVGAWMLEVQERLVTQQIEIFKPTRILDVGGGHGQLARPLCSQGYNVTVLGSTPACAHRIEELVKSGACAFTTGNVIELPFDENSFEVVLCVRLLTHCTAWPTIIKELCRVARDGVIVDYPTSQSLNAIAPMLFGAKKRIEKDTRTWTLFRHELEAIHNAQASLLAKWLHLEGCKRICRSLLQGAEKIAIRTLGQTNQPDWRSASLLRTQHPWQSKAW